MFSNCSGECCTCRYGDLPNGCYAGSGDDDYVPTEIEQVVDRLNQNKYPYDRKYMIEWLKERGYEYVDR